MYSLVTKLVLAFSAVSLFATDATRPALMPEAVELEASSPAGEAHKEAPVKSERMPAATTQSALADAPPTTPPSPVLEPVSPEVAVPATVVAESAPLTLVDAFSVEQNPGAGSLQNTISGTDTTEKITLGAATGIYGMAMLFKASALPKAMARDFGGSNVIQVALGTLRGRLAGQVAQFSAITFLSKVLPKARIPFPLLVPSGKEPASRQMGLLLFTSPATPNEQSDEDKLKSTYFAQGGMAYLALKGKARLIDVKAQGKRYPFRMQPLEIELAAELATPFNAQENKLTGKIEIPFYWPEGAAAESLLQRIASESLGANSGVTLPEDLNPGRDLAGSKKKETPRKKRLTTPKGM